jgi:hypothetical protein
VLACDGCGKTALQEGNSPAFPPGWLRLSVTGRPAGDATAVLLVRVDICSPECAPKALEDTATRVAVD